MRKYWIKWGLGLLGLLPIGLVCWRMSRQQSTSGWDEDQFFRSELDQEIDLQERRVDSLDSKGGILLIFVAVLVGAVKDTDKASDMQLVAQWLAAGAGLLIVLSLFFRSGSSIDPVRLRGLYSGQPESVIRKVVFDTRAALLGMNRKTGAKAWLLFVSLLLLIVSLGFLVAGTMTKAEGDSNERPEQPKQTATSSPGPTPSRQS
ncbi:hypothetical protein ABTX60_11925 [Streptomyces sp. NPDC126510]|uniref:hypothetical protein n=1 Tax=Streptomyces sp. NPDC126510 TaxID=3155317 RepID=UPI00332099D6